MGFIPFFLGYICNFLPMKLAFLAGQRVKDQEDRMSIVITAGMIFYLIYYIMLLLIAVYLKQFYFWIFVFFVPLWGYFALLYRELYAKWKGSKRVNQLQPQVVEKLKDYRSKILSWT